MSQHVDNFSSLTLENSSWQVLADHIDPNDYFGVMVANGMIGLVSDARPMHIREVVLNGVFDRYKRGRVSNILQAFNPFNLDLAVNDRMVEAPALLSYSQSLDMKEATLRSKFSTSKVEVMNEVIALRNLPFSALVSFEIKAKEDLQFTVFNHLNAPDHLQDVQNFYSEIDRPHVKIPLMTSVAKSPSGNIKLATSNSYIFEGDREQEPTLIHEDWDFNRHLVKFSHSLAAGESFRFHLVSSTCSSVHVSDPQNEAERLSIFAKLEGAERLVHRHRTAWEELWKSDIEIEGDPQVQRDIRLMLYYLYASVRGQDQASVYHP